MDNAIFSFPKPINEPVKAYAPGSSEKSSLKKALDSLNFSAISINKSAKGFSGSRCSTMPFGKLLIKQELFKSILPFSY